MKTLRFFACACLFAATALPAVATPNPDINVYAPSLDPMACMRLDVDYRGLRALVADLLKPYQLDARAYQDNPEDFPGILRTLHRIDEARTVSFILADLRHRRESSCL